MFTTFLKDFYYEVNPENTTETEENGLWKKFVNTEKRVLNILSNLKYSADHMIQKPPLCTPSGRHPFKHVQQGSRRNFTAWGTEMIQDENRYQFETQRIRANRTYDDKDNGRANTINMWMAIRVQKSGIPI